MKKKVFGLLIVVALIGIALTGLVKSQIKKDEEIPKEQLGADVTKFTENEGLKAGNNAPNFTLKTLSGETVKLSDYKGKKVILNFWATWCPPCKAEMPHMQNYYENAAKKDNVEILAVNLTSGDHGIDRVKEFVESYGLTFSIPLDEDSSVGKKFEAFTIPTTYIIDTSGRIQRKIVGPMDEQMMSDLVSSVE